MVLEGFKRNPCKSDAMRAFCFIITNKTSASSREPVDQRECCLRSVPSVGRRCRKGVLVAGLVKRLIVKVSQKSLV